MQGIDERAGMARRKLTMSRTEIDELLSRIRSLCPVAPLTVETETGGGPQPHAAG